MKKTVSAILVCVLLACSLLSFTSCSKILAGAYSAEEDQLIGKSSTTYEFGLFGNVTLTVNTLGDETVEKGKYEFNDAGDKITFTFENEDGTPDVTTYGFASGTENGKSYIRLTTEGFLSIETTYFKAD